MILHEHFIYSKIFAEREYQCLGQWQEDDVVYIYTKRRDVGTYECFVGTMNGQEIFIKEAGEHCQREVDPNRYGMQLKQTKYCNSNHHKQSKHPTIGHMNPVNVPTNRLHLSNNFDSVPPFSPMPPVDKTLGLPIPRINEIRVPESTTIRNQEPSTVATVPNKTTGHKDAYQHDYNEKMPTTDSNETIQFIGHNETSLAKDEQQYVVSTVVTGPGSIQATKNKSSNIINESDFNHSPSSFQINLLVLSVTLIASCRLISIDWIDEFDWRLQRKAFCLWDKHSSRVLNTYSSSDRKFSALLWAALSRQFLFECKIHILYRFISSRIINF